MASAEEHPELFWALRGGNYGVVTSFEYRLHPLDPPCSLASWPGPWPRRARCCGASATSWPTPPTRWASWPTLRLAPALPTIPQELHGQPIVALIVCYTGPIDQGAQVVRPLREFKPPALDTRAKPYVAHQAMFDAAYPHCRHYYWKAWKLPPLTDAAIDVIVQQASVITSPLSAIPIFTLGGAVASVDDDATAFTGRSAAHDINFVASWLPDDPEPERHKAWARAAWEGNATLSDGVYVNYLSDEPAPHGRAPTASTSTPGSLRSRANTIRPTPSASTRTSPRHADEHRRPGRGTFPSR